MATEITKLIPVTATFDGCWCSDECPMLFSMRCGLNRGVVGYPWSDNPKSNRPELIAYSYIRTRECCRLFGMVEERYAQPNATTTDANDNETLRKWTSE